MRALVTGASGFIGGHVADALVRSGHDVVALVRPTSRTRHLEEIEAELAFGDMTDPRSIRRAAEGADWVFHTAAVVGSYGTWEAYRRVGVVGTQNVVDAASEAGVQRFLHFGSIAVYGFQHSSGVVFTEDMPFDESPEPWNHYVREKVLSEKIVWRAHEQGRLSVTSLRPSIVLGARDRNVVTRTAALLELPMTGLIGWGNNRVACVVVQELADIAVRAARSAIATGKAYNISGRAPITQRQLVEAYARALGRPLMPFRVPYRLAMLSAQVMEGAYGAAGIETEPIVSRIGVVLLGQDYGVDCTRAVKDLGWKGEASYRRAVEESVRFYREHLG